MRRLILVGVLCLGAIAQPALASTRQVSIPSSANTFSPSRVVAVVGDRVNWTNNSFAAHTVTFEDGSLDERLSHSESVASDPFKLGSYAYHCEIHFGMRGSVGVYELWLGGPARPVRAGTFVKLSGLAQAGVTSVTIQRKVDGAFATVATRTPGVDGSFSYLSRASAPGVYRAIGGGDTSPLAKVRVKPKVAISAERVRGSTFRIATSTAPAQVGATVALQRYSALSFSWKTIAKKELGTRSRATFRFTASKRTKLRVKELRAVRGFTPGTSRTVTVSP